MIVLVAWVGRRRMRVSLVKEWTRETYGEELRGGFLAISGCGLPAGRRLGVRHDWVLFRDFRGLRSHLR